MNIFVKYPIIMELVSSRNKNSNYSLASQSNMFEIPELTEEEFPIGLNYNEISYRQIDDFLYKPFDLRSDENNVINFIDILYKNFNDITYASNMVNDYKKIMKHYLNERLPHNQTIVEYLRQQKGFYIYDDFYNSRMFDGKKIKNEQRYWPIIMKMIERNPSDNLNLFDIANDRNKIKSFNQNDVDYWHSAVSDIFKNIVFFDNKFFIKISDPIFVLEDSFNKQIYYKKTSTKIKVIDISIKDYINRQQEDVADERKLYHHNPLWNNTFFFNFSDTSFVENFYMNHNNRKTFPIKYHQQDILKDLTFSNKNIDLNIYSICRNIINNISFHIPSLDVKHISNEILHICSNCRSFIDAFESNNKQKINKYSNEILDILIDIKEELKKTNNKNVFGASINIFPTEQVINSIFFIKENTDINEIIDVSTLTL